MLAAAPLSFSSYYAPDIEILYYMPVKLSYKTIARTNPPTIANPPLAIFATAALVVDEAVALADVLEEVALIVELEVLTVRVVARVPFEGVEDVDKMVGVGDADEFVDTTVLVLSAMDELLVNPLPVANWTVTVEDTEPVAEEESLVDEAEPPVMWNGNENWKVEGSESREILKP